MKRSRATLLFFFMALTLFFGCAPVPEGDDKPVESIAPAQKCDNEALEMSVSEQEGDNEAIEIIDEVNQQFEESASRQDAAAMAEHYTEDGLFFDGTRIIHRRALEQEYKRAFDSGSMAFLLLVTEASLEYEFGYGMGTWVTKGAQCKVGYVGNWMGIYKEEDGKLKIHRLMTISKR